MNRLDVYSEPIPPNGATDAEAIRNVVGRTDLSLWELLLRESFQNSWDQRVSDSIGFSVTALIFGESECERLKESVFTKQPVAGSAVGAWLRESDQPSALVITDRRTKGLGGPTRAGVTTPPGVSRNFVDFVRNNGRQQKAFGGGTYGFGKGVFFDASKVNTCLIYSQTMVDGEIESRFIVMAVGQKFTVGDSEFTGRHWWGDLASDDVIEPVCGPEARDLALQLGISNLGESETGTSICVIDPMVDNTKSHADGLEHVIREIRDAFVEWCWPHLVDLNGGPSVELELSFLGQEVEIPNVHKDPWLRGLADCFAIALSKGQASYPFSKHEISTQRPVIPMGTLVMKSDPAVVRSGKPRRFEGQVALMRAPHIVVKYLPCSPDADGNIRSGVFVASAAGEELFAKAEPATHDDWKPQELGLASGSTNPVKVALTKIAAAMAAGTQVAVSSQPGQGKGLAKAAGDLGRFVMGVRGSGPGGEDGGGGSGGAARLLSLSPIARLKHENKAIVAIFEGRFLAPPQSIVAERLTALPGVVLLDGDIEKSKPAIAQVPIVLRWTQGSKVVSEDASVRVQDFDQGPFEVEVAQPADTSITLTLRLEGGDNS